MQRVSSSIWSGELTLFSGGDSEHHSNCPDADERIPAAKFRCEFSGCRRNSVTRRYLQKPDIRLAGAVPFYTQFQAARISAGNSNSQSLNAWIPCTSSASQKSTPGWPGQHPSLLRWSQQIPEATKNSNPANAWQMSAMVGSFAALGVLHGQH